MSVCVWGIVACVLMSLGSFIKNVHLPKIINLAIISRNYLATRVDLVSNKRAQSAFPFENYIN